MSTERPPEELMDEFLDRVNELFSKVRDWSKRIDPDVEFEEGEVKIHEEEVGEYCAPLLAVKLKKRKKVQFIPRGRWIIGADGRVDLKSNLGTETLIYTNKDRSFISVRSVTDSGKIIEKSIKPNQDDIAEGWLFVQNRSLSLFPNLDYYLFQRLMEVLTT